MSTSLFHSDWFHLLRPGEALSSSPHTIPKLTTPLFAFNFWFVVRYTLIQLFSRYGKLSKLDFLFHKNGPLKGKPRGYAFVEYADAEVRSLYCTLLMPTLRNLQSAAKALAACHEKLIRGRKISVTYANQVYYFDFRKEWCLIRAL